MIFGTVLEMTGSPLPVGDIEKAWPKVLLGNGVRTVCSVQIRS